MEYQIRKCEREPLARKKKRKADLQRVVYFHKLRKWEAREPKRWRLLAHWRWKQEKPKRKEGNK